MASNNLRLQLEIAASGAGGTVAELLRVRQAIEATAAQSGGITQLASAMGRNYEAARRFAEGLGLAPEAATRGIRALRELNAVGANSETRFAVLTTQLGVTVRQFQALDRAARSSGQGQAEGTGLAGQGLAALAFKYNNVVGAIQNLVATAKPAYDLLIGSNEKLNAQLLASQTNLASTSRLFVGGTEVTDPTAKIKASQGALQAALKQIERDTESLVGVTSGEVNELFQITLQNAAALNNQSKQFPDAISAATSLTKGWAASLNVAGVPLNQARQEINSILKGQVDQNSVLAKSLNITNDQVRQWQAQGRLVDELNKKLEPYVAGNALAARSIAGIGSNIQDIIERLGRATGQPFLAPIIDALDEVYKYLKTNEVAISTFFNMLTDEALRSGGDIAKAFAPLGKTLLEIGADLGPIALSAIKGLLQVFVGLAQVIAPLVGVMAQVIKVFADFAATDLGGVVVQTAVIIASLTQLTTIVGAFAATALPALWAGVLATVTSMGTLYTAIVAVATGNTALALSLPLVQTALRLLTASAVALNLALIPLAAAIGLAVLVRTTKDLEDANDALEAYGQQIVDTAGAVGNITVELNKFNKIRKEGGALTEEQIKREKQLKASALAQVEGINARIEALKGLTKLNDDQSNQRDNNIKQLEALKKKLDVATGGLTIQAKELEKLGTTAEQLSKKVEAAQRNITTGGGGDPEVFKKSVGELTKTIEQQAKLRQVNLADAAQSLEQIRSDVRVEVDVQQQAKETIVKIYSERTSAIKEELANGLKDQRESLAELAEIRDRGEVKDDPKATAAIRKKAAQEIVAIRKEQGAAELAEIDASKSQVEALQAAQRLGEAEGDRALTALKGQELAKRLEQNKIASENATSEVERQQLLAEKSKLNADLDKLAGDYQKRVNQRILGDYDEQLTELEAFNAQKLVSEEDYLSAKTALQTQRADREIGQLTEQLAKLAATDVEGREAVTAQISKLQVQKIKVLEESYAAELVLIKDREAKALDLVTRSEQERSIALQKLVNNRTIRLEDADKERGRSNIVKQRAELEQARDFEAALARTAGAARSPEAERAYQQQVREARSRTLGVTLQLLQTEGNEQERLRTLALKGIEGEIAARARGVDLQLSQIATVKGARDRATKDAEQNANREVFVLELATKTLERQNSLLLARNELQKANYSAALSGNDLELARVNRALEIKKLLDSNVSTQERIILEKELFSLSRNGSETAYELAERKFQIEQRNAEVKRESLLFEQAAARASLSVEQQRIDSANQRAVIEARIAELKAKQGILDAESALRERKLTDAKAIDAAKLALEQAKAQAPGRERDRAVADAESKVKLVKNDAVNNQGNAVQAIDLARQQADFASQTTKQAIEQQRSFGSIKDLQTETLKVQQGMVLKQLEMAEAAKRYADELERAKAALTETSTRTVKPLVFEARAGGGSVRAGQSYIVGENSPEVFVPGVSGTVLNREQVLKNLGSLGGLNLNVGGGKGNDNREVIGAIQSLEQTIRSRPPTPIVANFAGADDGQLDKLFAIQRSALRGV